MEELRKWLEEVIAEMEENAKGRHMNDLEYEKHTALCDVLEKMDEIGG